VSAPPAKKPRTSLFAHYSRSVEENNHDRTPEWQLMQYLETINSPSFDLMDKHSRHAAAQGIFTLEQVV